jgi:hypothetical protein
VPAGIGVSGRHDVALAFTPQIPSNGAKVSGS